MMRGRVPLFRSCGKAIKQFAGGQALSEQQVRDLHEGRARLRSFMGQMARDENLRIPRVVRAMNYVHPDVLYCSDSLIRDLGDICLTFKRIAEGKGRSLHEKISHADLFCMGMHYEK
jgi:hypothetical protein